MTQPGREFAAKQDSLSLGLSIHLKSQFGPQSLAYNTSTVRLVETGGSRGVGKVGMAASLDPDSVRDTASEELDRT